MTRGLLGLAALCVSCVAPATVAEGPPSAPATPPVPVRAPALRAQYFQVAPDEAFWVEHDATGDLVVARGARLALDDVGRVRAAAWERDGSLAGCQAIAARLGGGLVCWNGPDLYRAAEPMGALTAVTLPAGLRGAAIRGVRSGTREIVVWTELGPLALAPGASVATPRTEPALADEAAQDGVTVKLDVFGRAFVAVGESPARDITPNAASLRSLFLTPTTLAIESFEQRFVVGPGGALASPERFERFTMDPVASLATAFPGSRLTTRADWPYAVREVSPLHSVAASGAWLDETHALGYAQGLLGVVDVASGRVTHLGAEELPASMPCEPFRAPDGVLVLCTYEAFEGYGAFVLRTRAGEPPVLERAFSADGGFVGDADGALAFLGPCEARLRVFDPSEERSGGPLGDGFVSPVICVRTGPSAWATRRVVTEPGEALVTVVPRLDGRVAALVRPRARGAVELPGVEAPLRRRVDGAVTIVSLPSQLEGQTLARDPGRSLLPTRALPRLVDRTFTWADDDTIVGWTTPAGSGIYGAIGEGARSSVALSPGGGWSLHGPPPGTRAMVSGGRFALVIDEQGTLRESRDHGRTWTAAGSSPVSEASFHGACSALGCVLDDVVRLGWGEGAFAPSVREPLKPAPPGPDRRPRLVCGPASEPRPIPAEEGVEGAELPTIWGDSMLLSGLVMDPADSLLGPDVPPVASAITLRYREPFDPRGVSRSVRVELPDPSVLGQLSASPLVDAAGHVSAWIPAGMKDLWLDDGRVAVTDAPDPGRGSYFGEGGGVSAGVTLAPGRFLVTSWTRRRFALETRGAGPLPPAQHGGLDVDVLGRRLLLLGREGDQLGVLVLDGNAPETAGIAPWDRVRGAVGTTRKVAPWSALALANTEPCRADARGLRVLVPLDPSLWFRLDEVALPGVAFGFVGLALVRWGAERVCLEGLHAAVSRTPRGLEPARLVGRWPAVAGAPEATLLGGGLATSLACRVEVP